MYFYVVEFPHIPEEVNHSFAVSQLDSHGPLNMRSECCITLECSVPLTSEIDIPLTDVC